MHKSRLIRLKHMHGTILFTINLNGLLRMLPHVFYEPCSSHSACYVWFSLKKLVLKLNRDELVTARRANYLVLSTLTNTFILKSYENAYFDLD